MLVPLGIERGRPCARAVTPCGSFERCAGEATDGYDPPPHVFVAPDLPVYIGACGERCPTASLRKAADGVFVAGVAPLLFDELVGWARIGASHRDRRLLT